MQLLLLLLGLAFVTHIWLCIRVGRSSTALAVATFFLGPIAALYTLFKNRGDKATSITWSFVASVAFSVIFIVSAWQTLVPLLEAQNAEYGLPDVSTQKAPERPAVGNERPLAAASAAALASEAAAPVATDAIDSFSQALSASGLVHTVTRLPASTSLPSGVTSAALFSVVPMTIAGNAASAPAAKDTSATLFECDSANACRNLAGAHLRQNGADHLRLLQNGLLLLSLPQPEGDDPDLTPAAVSGAFKKL